MKTSAASTTTTSTNTTELKAMVVAIAAGLAAYKSGQDTFVRCLIGQAKTACSLGNDGLAVYTATLEQIKEENQGDRNINTFIAVIKNNVAHTATLDVTSKNKWTLSGLASDIRALVDAATAAKALAQQKAAAQAAKENARLLAAKAMDDKAAKQAAAELLAAQKAAANTAKAKKATVADKAAASAALKAAELEAAAAEAQAEAQAKAQAKAQKESDALSAKVAAAKVKADADAKRKAQCAANRSGSGAAKDVAPAPVKALPTTKLATAKGLAEQMAHAAMDNRAATYAVAEAYRNGSKPTLKQITAAEDCAVTLDEISQRMVSFLNN